MTGRDRKNSLKALFGEPSPARAPETKAAEPASEKPVEAKAERSAAVVHSPSEPVEKAETAYQRASSGAVKAMGLSLSKIQREVEEARKLREALESSEQVVSVPTDRVEDSFVKDRLSHEERDDPDFIALVESMRESGQQVPVLLRPHPEKAGAYQVAYGHRRVKAARRLEQPVKAIVRHLTDDELVLAQGKENAERRNLSFIERAQFARALVERGFDRKLVGEALSVQKSELSRLLQVAESVPPHVIHTIGPAPKAGRARWMALAELLNQGSQGLTIIANREVNSTRFREASSDERFRLLYERLAARKTGGRAGHSEALIGPDGQVFAEMRKRSRKLDFGFAKHVDPAFIDRIAKLVSEEYARFEQDNGDRQNGA